MSNLTINTLSLLNLNKNEIQAWLANFDTILCDCDGVLWLDDHVLPNVAEIIAKLQNDYKKRIYFVTNNGRRTRYDMWQRVLKMGFQIEETQIIAPAHTLAKYLQRHHRELFEKQQRKCYLIGSEAIGKELEAVGISYFGLGPDIVHSKGDIEAMAIKLMKSEPVGAVIVGHDEHFSFAKIMKATNYLDKKLPNGEFESLFLATNTEAVYKYPTVHIPDTGAFVSAVETSAERKAIDMGKPNPLICEDLIKDGFIVPQRTLMIGDNAKIDITFGRNCGFKTLLVDSGQDRLRDVQKKAQLEPLKWAQYLPDFHLPQFGDLLAFL